MDAFVLEKKPWAKCRPLKKNNTNLLNYYITNSYMEATANLANIGWISRLPLGGCDWNRKFKGF
jgi:hypothetical protein